MMILYNLFKQPKPDLRFWQNMEQNFQFMSQSFFRAKKYHRVLFLTCFLLESTLCFLIFLCYSSFFWEILNIAWDFLADFFKKGPGADSPFAPNQDLYDALAIHEMTAPNLLQPEPNMTPAQLEQIHHVNEFRLKTYHDLQENAMQELQKHGYVLGEKGLVSPNPILQTTQATLRTTAWVILASLAYKGTVMLLHAVFI